VLEDMERAIDDGVNSYKALTRDVRVLPAGGAVELELSKVSSTAPSPQIPRASFKSTWEDSSRRNTTIPCR